MSRRFCLNCTALLIVLAFGARAAARSTTVVFPSDDTWVREGGKSSAPRGRSTKMLGGSQRVALVKFNLISFLPPGTPIVSAILRLRPRGMWPGTTVSVDVVLGAWNEDQTTDLNAPAVATAPMPPSTTVPGSGLRFVDVDVTDIVRGWVDKPADNQGFALRAAQKVIFAT